ncbi:hypothetical protein ACT3RR_18530 [Ewingella sp. AOP8-B2-18]
MSDILTFIITLTSAMAGGVIAGYYSLKATKEAHKHQKNLAEDNEKLIISSLLQALHDELETIFCRYQEGMGCKLESLEDGQPLAFYYPLVSDFFTVYHGNSFLIGRINNNTLRKNIIKTYTLAKGMIDSFRMNNDLVQKVEHWESIYEETRSPTHEYRLHAHNNSLIMYAAILKQQHFELKENVEMTINLLLEQGMLSEKTLERR